jgi:UDP-N-acetylglucosamine 2-epimerase (non-hydrolysing)
MTTKRILVVMGTRPEVIKMAPVVNALKSRTARCDVKTCVTGQHREMLDDFVAFFRIPVDYDLHAMKKGQTLAELTATLVRKLDGVMEDFRPHVALVQGDTTSAFAGALAANYRQVQVGHVEAGLRTGNKFAPFPEELNRSLIGVLADHHFAPTERAREALLREGVDPARILVTGNTVVDALMEIVERLQSDPPPLGAIEQVVASGRKIVLITGHRRENFGRGFENICLAIRTLAGDFADCSFIYPVHMNPHVQQPVFQLLSGLANVHLVPPMGYFAFVRLMTASCLILTDSGGIQEEAPSLGKPVVVMRDVTERPEAVGAGCAILVGSEKEGIVREVSRLLASRADRERMRSGRNPFGDGRAALRIADYLERLPPHPALSPAGGGEGGVDRQQ